VATDVGNISLIARFVTVASISMTDIGFQKQEWNTVYVLNIPGEGSRLALKVVNGMS
jgi:hypothetical protein